MGNEPKSPKGNVLRTIPPANLRTCLFCREYLDTSANGTYQRGTGWFRRQPQRGSHNRSGTNSAARISWSDEYACSECMSKLAKGIPVGQMGLWDDR